MKKFLYQQYFSTHIADFTPPMSCVTAQHKLEDKLY